MTGQVRQVEKDIVEIYRALPVTPQKYPIIFIIIFIIYSGYKLSQLGFFREN